MFGFKKKSWDVGEVAGDYLPSVLFRTYLEHRSIRLILDDLNFESAVEFGCGYGRNLPILAELAKNVSGYEREYELSQIAESTLKDIDNVAVHNVSSLASLPVENGAFGLVMTFTVLQHIPEPEVLDIINEIKRVVASDGYVLICEESSSNVCPTINNGKNLVRTWGRTVQWYQEKFAPLTLVSTAERKVEPALRAKQKNKFGTDELRRFWLFKK